MAEMAARLRRVDFTWKSTGVHACRNVDLELFPGEIHALVGENGAGKTTLGHILAGTLVPDRGTLAVDGIETDLGARNSGIPGVSGLVRQRSIWPGSLKVWEAAILGRRNGPRGRRKAREIFRRTAEAWNLSDINPDSWISGLDAAALQRCELTAALMYDPKILILDEPASAWEEGRDREFRSVLREARRRRLALLLITHRIDDVFALADRVTVMRHGTVRGTWPTGEIDQTGLVSEMFGEDAAGSVLPASDVLTSEPSARKSAAATPILRADRLNLTSAGRTRLEEVSLEVRPGEILAVTGLREEGLASLEDVITGNGKANSGNIYIHENKIEGSPHHFRNAGMRYIPSDKTGRGASLSSTMAENMMVLESGRIAGRGILRPSGMRRWTESRRKSGRIDGHAGQKLGELSGGNIQKVILERELHGRIPVIVAADPAWGLDERSRLALYRRLRRNADEGTAILLLASDLDEALENADRLAVMSGGKLSEIREIGSWTREEIAVRIAASGEER